jgi:hypothetical protein
VRSVSVKRSRRPTRESWILSLYFYSSSNKNFRLVEFYVLGLFGGLHYAIKWYENEYVLQVLDRPLHRVKSTLSSSVYIIFLTWVNQWFMGCLQPKNIYHRS